MSDQNPVKTDATSDDERHYVVRLLWGVPATSPRDAVRKVLDQLARYGIIDWIYQTRDPDGDLTYVNGDLEEIDVQAIADRLDAGGEEE